MQAEALVPQPKYLFVELFHRFYCSGSMCVGVTLWYGCGGVVSVCRLRH